MLQALASEVNGAWSVISPDAIKETVSAGTLASLPLQLLCVIGVPPQVSIHHVERAAS